MGSLFYMYISISIYTPDGGTHQGVKNKKQSMNDLKLRRLNELNSRLREDLERSRIKGMRGIDGGNE